jgi:hypothetical protein
MAPMVCRLRLRKGEPLGLSIYQGPTFTSLPPEIREKIYKLLLISSEPIVVSPKPLNDSPYDRSRGQFTSLAPLTLGLLAVNTTISKETTPIFYRSNTFKVSREERIRSCRMIKKLHDHWDILYSFLRCVGPDNRSCLRNLEMEITRPELVTKEDDGTVSSIASGSFWMRKVHARDLYPRLHEPVWDDEQYSRGPTVDYIAPGIEAVFRLLGSAPEIQGVGNVELVIKTEFNEFPLIRINGMGKRCGWSNDIPDHIEMMRERFTGQSVDVVWEWQCDKSYFLKLQEERALGGWEILKVSEVSGPLENGWPRGPEAYITLKRKRGTGPSQITAVVE